MSAFTGGKDGGTDVYKCTLYNLSCIYIYMCTAQLLRLGIGRNVSCEMDDVLHTCMYVHVLVGLCTYSCL